MKYKQLTEIKNDERACESIFRLVTAGYGPTQYGHVEDSELGYITLWEKYGRGATRLYISPIVAPLNIIMVMRLNR